MRDQVPNPQVSPGFNVALPFSPFLFPPHRNQPCHQSLECIIIQQGNTMPQPGQAWYHVNPSTGDPARKGRSTQTNNTYAPTAQWQLTRHTLTQLYSAIGKCVLKRTWSVQDSWRQIGCNEPVFSSLVLVCKFLQPVPFIKIYKNIKLIFNV